MRDTASSSHPASRRADRPGPLDRLLAGRFERERLLSEGPATRVSLARDRDTGQRVALKEFLPAAGHPPPRQACAVEFRTLSRLAHAGIPRAIERYPAFFTMEAMEGTSLARSLPRLRRALAGKGAVEEIGRVLAIFTALADVLAYLHGRGILHGDLKPEHVILPDGAGEPAARLLDFGFATRAAVGPVPCFRGTPPYTAPEILLFGRADARSDLWSLGIMLFQALTGRIPYAPEGPAAGTERFRERLPRLRSLCPVVSVGLDRLVAHLLERDPAKRIPSAGRLRRALLALRGIPEAPIQDEQGASLLLVPPLIGRRREIRRLLGAAPPAGGRAAAVWIHGPEGIGKSRLLQEARSLSPIFERTGVRIRYPAPEGGEAGPLPRRLLDALPRPRGLPPLPPVPPGRESLSARSVVRHEILVAAREALVGLAGEGPVAIALEDLDELGLHDREDLLEIASTSSETPILWVLTSRRPPEDILGPSPGARRFRESLRGIPLAPLSPGEGRRLACAILGPHRLPEWALDALTAAAHGNPRRTEALVQRLSEGPLVRRDGAWTADPEALRRFDWPGERPGRVEEAASLSPAAALALRWAAVLGERFSIPHLRQLLGEAGADPDAAVADLLGRPGGLRPSDADADQLEWVRLPFREGILRSMPREGRAAMHRAVHALLVRERAAGREVPPSTLAHHAYEGGIKRAAAEALRAQWNQAMAAYDFDVLAGIEDRLLSVLDPADPSDRLDVFRYHLGSVAIHTFQGEYDRAEERLRRAEPLLAPGLPTAVFLQRKARLALARERYAEAERFFREGLGAFPADARGLPETPHFPAQSAGTVRRNLDAGLGVCLARQGRFDEARPHCAPLARAATPSPETMFQPIHIAHEILLLLTGRWPETEERLRARTDMMAKPSASAVWSHLGQIARERGDLESARALLRTDREYATSIRLFGAALQSAHHLAEIGAEAGSAAEARRALAEVLSEARRIGKAAVEAASLLSLGWLRLLGGAGTAVRSLLEAARAPAGRSSDLEVFLRFGLLEAALRVSEGNVGEAAACLEAALAREGAGETRLHPLLRIAEARVRRLAGDTDAARAALAHAAAYLHARGTALPALGLVELERGCLEASAGAWRTAGAAFSAAAVLLAPAGLLRTPAAILVTEAPETWPIPPEGRRDLGGAISPCLSMLDERAARARDAALLVRIRSFRARLHPPAAARARKRAPPPEPRPAPGAPEEILRRILSTVRAERGALLIRGRDGWVVRGAVLPPGDPPEDPGLSISFSLVEAAAARNHPVVIADALADPRFGRRMSVRNLRVRSALCFPFRMGLRGAGMLYLEHRGRPGFFGPADEGALEGLVGIAALALEREFLYHQSMHDGLTGIWSHGHFLHRLEEAITAARRAGEPISVVLLDLDGFKSVNEHYGHLAGSRVLQEVAAVLEARLPEGSLLGRYGGDEFEAGLPGLSSPRACRLAQDLTLDLSRHRFAVRGGTVYVGASGGVAAFPRDGADPQSLLLKADGALYRAKHLGGHRILAASDPAARRPVETWGFEAVATHREGRTILKGLAALLRRPPDAGGALSWTLDRLARSLEADRGALLAGRGTRLRHAATIGDAQVSTILRSEAAREARRSCAPLLRTDPGPGPPATSRAILCVPWSARGRRRGLLYLERSRAVRGFEVSDLHLAEGLCRFVAETFLG